MNLLQSIGLRHSTDKAVHAFNGVTYLDVYEEDVPLNAVECMLEIGVYKGASLRTWREYLQRVYHMRRRN